MRKRIILIWLAIMWAGAGFAQERDFVVSDLRGDTSRPAPLLVALHPAGSNPRAFRNQIGLDAAARKAGLIVVYPTAAGPEWNAARGSADSDYLTRLIRSFRADPRVTDQPVIVVGHASGGAMALGLACDRPDLIAGLGMVATKVPRNATCPRGKPKPAVFVHGTGDPISPHDGSDASLSAADSLAIWAKRNRCRATLKVTRSDRNARDGTSVVNRVYTTCQAALTHVVVLGAGHGWPTGRAGKGGQLGPQSGEINASETLVTFLKPLVGR